MAEKWAKARFKGSINEVRVRGAVRDWQIQEMFREETERRVCRGTKSKKRGKWNQLAGLSWSNYLDE